MKAWFSTGGGPLDSRPDNNEIYVMGANGGYGRRLTQHPENDFAPVWSPDSEWIAFVSVRNGNAEIFRVRPDGRDEQRLTDQSGYDGAPAWSPDGEWIAFSSERSGSVNIYRMRPDGSDQQRLTTGEERDRNPAWSPDGEWIVFERRRDIYRMRADGSQQRHLTDHSNYSHEKIWAAGGHDSPVWSPDGEWIALVYADRDLYRMRADGSGEELLALDAVSPIWSPDGEWIACTPGRGSDRAIYVVQPGGQLKAVTSSSRIISQLAWSPDGGWIAFERYKGQSDQFHTEFDIYRVRADGSRKQRLTRYMGGQPAYSPDGKWVAYVADPLWSPAIDFPWNIPCAAGLLSLGLAWLARQYGGAVCT